MDPHNAADQSMYDGPSYVFVDALNMAAVTEPTGSTLSGAPGTIIYDLEPVAGGTQPVGSYPQVFTNTADITGATLLARLTPKGGLFADSYFWDNVIDANTLTGKFATCAIDGPYAGSVLLGGLTCIYDDKNNVDLSLKRVRRSTRLRV